MPSHQSKIKMLPDSSGKILSVDLVSRDPSYPIMGRNLTARYIGTSARN